MRVVYEKNLEGTDYLELVLSKNEIQHVEEFKGAHRVYPFNPFNRKNKLDLFVRRSTDYNSKELDVVE